VDLHRSRNWPWLHNVSTSDSLAKGDDYPVPPKNTRRIFLKNLLCSQMVTISGPKYNFGSRVNQNLKESVDLCINEILKM
jgi:hypothetical protein